MLILLNNFPFNGIAMMYVEIQKMQTKNDKQSFSLLAFSMKDLATKRREKIVCEQTNQWAKQIIEHKTKWRFPNVPFFKNTHANASFSFQFL